MSEMIQGIDLYNEQFNFNLKFLLSFLFLAKVTDKNKQMKTSLNLKATISFLHDFRGMLS